MSKMTKKSNILYQDIIENKILLIRGKKVMLDSDLAKLYEIETRVLNQAVKRNKERFSDDFMFSLKREEIMNLSQFVIGLKIKHSPNVQVFTEQGVAMLSSVLSSKKAVEVNIAIMRTFVNIRKFVSTYKGTVAKHQIVLNSQIFVNLSKKILANITTFPKIFLKKFPKNLKIYA